MKAQIYTKHYIVCPHCQGDTGSVINHLLKEKLPREVGPWDCDSCGNYFELVIHSATDIDIKIVDGKRIEKLEVLLVLPPQDKPLYVVVEGMDFVKNGDPIDLDKSFHFDENSCPTNWLKVDRIYFDGDADPHGLFRFVRAIPAKQAQEIDDNIHSKNGYESGSGASDTSTGQEVIEVLFPEVKEGFIPENDDVWSNFEKDLDNAVGLTYTPKYSDLYRPEKVIFITRMRYLF